MWHDLSRNQGAIGEYDDIPIAGGNLSELRLEAEEMVSTITIIAKQHLIGIVCPLTYLTWIIKWRNPS
jgi:hypothetical protein